VQDDRNPEHDAERDLLRLVAELSLAKKSTGPATQERQQMKRAFGDTAASGGGSPLIRPIGKEGGKTHDENDEQINGDGGIHALLPALPFLEGFFSPLVEQCPLEIMRMVAQMTLAIEMTETHIQIARRMPKSSNFD
jgi:hypothetical protein